MRIDRHAALVHDHDVRPELERHRGQSQINGDYRLPVRAEVADAPGQSHTTKWVDAK
jgi:hypothetical protein